MDHVKINYMGFYRIRFLLPVHLNALVGGRVMYMYVCAGNSVRVCVCAIAELKLCLADSRGAHQPLAYRCQSALEK